jgi:ssDNA-binding Zn-finger/Zn-ribbon topoisomerase 1
MPYTRCPHCGRVQVVQRSAIGQHVGCLGFHCERSFVATEYRRHAGPLSRAIFFGLIAFALVLGIVWTERHFGFLQQLFTR